VKDLAAAFQRDVRLFHAFPPAATRELARRSSVRRYGKGERLCHAGEPARSVWALLSGRVCVQRRHWNGRNLGIEIMVPGDVIGLPALTHWSYPSELQATLGSEAAVIPRSVLLELMDQEPLVARSLFSAITQRLRFAERQLFLAQEPVETRLVAALLYLSEKFGSRLPLTHEEIGQMAATTAETTMRKLKSLAELGLIRRRRGEVVIVDRVKLAGLLPEGA